MEDAAAAGVKPEKKYNLQPQNIGCVESTRMEVEGEKYKFCGSL